MCVYMYVCVNRLYPQSLSIHPSIHLYPLHIDVILIIPSSVLSFSLLPFCQCLCLVMHLPFWWKGRILILACSSIHNWQIVNWKADINFPSQAYRVYPVKSFFVSMRTITKPCPKYTWVSLLSTPSLILHFHIILLLFNNCNTHNDYFIYKQVRV